MLQRGFNNTLSLKSGEMGHPNLKSESITKNMYGPKKLPRKINLDGAYVTWF